MRFIWSVAACAHKHANTHTHARTHTQGVLELARLVEVVVDALHLVRRRLCTQTRKHTHTRTHAHTGCARACAARRGSGRCASSGPSPPAYARCVCARERVRASERAHVRVEHLLLLGCKIHDISMAQIQAPGGRNRACAARPSRGKTRPAIPSGLESERAPRALRASARPSAPAGPRRGSGCGAGRQGEAKRRSHEQPRRRARRDCALVGIPSR